MTDRTVAITTEFIKLEQLLKLSGACPTGGAAKEAVRGGKVLVNGAPCTERGRKLRGGDTAEYDGVVYKVAAPSPGRA